MELNGIKAEFYSKVSKPPHPTNVACILDYNESGHSFIVTFYYLKKVRYRLAYQITSAYYCIAIWTYQ